jgi:hypothetical protein
MRLQCVEISVTIKDWLFNVQWLAEKKEFYVLIPYHTVV